MRNKVIALLFAVILCMSSVLPVAAVSSQPRITDDAGLLSDSEISALAQTLDEISERHQFDVVVHTTNGTGGQYIESYADDYYDYNDYGYSFDADGCILVVDMQEREWWISTCGYGITAINTDDVDYIGEQIQGDLSDGYYYDAFTSYAQLCDDFVTQAKSGIVYDSHTSYEEPYNWFFGILISLVIGFGVALVITLVMKSKLKSVRFQPAAKDYLVPGSMRVAVSRDIFLYRNVTKRAKPKESSGSGTHTSSSGRSHGGGGGSF